MFSFDIVLKRTRTKNKLVAYKFVYVFQGEPSPTTGSLFKPQMMQCTSGGSTTYPSVMNSASTLDGTQSNGFEFKPNSGSYSFGGFSFPGSLVNKLACGVFFLYHHLLRVKNLTCTVL